MNDITDEQFDALITKAMDELPQQYISDLQNVAIVMETAPTPEQRSKMNIDNQHVLLGLYEGVPRTMQTGNESGLLPGKITLFKNQITAVVHDQQSLFEQIKRTLWHEIAHYYGLDHDRMDTLVSKQKQ